MAQQEGAITHETISFSSPVVVKNEFGTLTCNGLQTQRREGLLAGDRYAAALKSMMERTLNEMESRFNFHYRETVWPSSHYNTKEAGDYTSFVMKNKMIEALGYLVTTPSGVSLATEYFCSDDTKMKLWPHVQALANSKNVSLATYAKHDDQGRVHFELDTLTQEELDHLKMEYAQAFARPWIRSIRSHCKLDKVAPFLKRDYVATITLEVEGNSDLDTTFKFDLVFRINPVEGVMSLKDTCAKTIAEWLFLTWETTCECQAFRLNVETLQVPQALVDQIATNYAYMKGKMLEIFSYHAENRLDRLMFDSPTDGEIDLTQHDITVFNMEKIE